MTAQRLIIGGVIVASATLTGWIVAREGNEHMPYRDRGGTWTVCAGVTGPQVVPGRPYSAEECDALNSGADWVQPKARLRSVQLGYSVLTHAEASLLHEIQRTHGTTGEVLYIPDADDAERMQQYGFLGLLRQLTALENPFWASRSVALAVDERGGAP